MLININKDNQEVSLLLPNKVKEDLINLSFEISYIEGREEYCLGILQDENGELIDNAFRKDERYRLFFDMRVHHLEDGDYVHFFFKDATGETYEIKPLTISQDIYPMENLLGGASMYMLPTFYGPSESFVIVSPEGRVAVIDGGNYKQGEADPLAQILRSHGKRVDDWFLTHYHSDHIGAILEILESQEYEDIRIGCLHFDFSRVEELFEKKGAGGSDADNDLLLWRKLQQAFKKTKRIEKLCLAKKGETIPLGKDHEIQILNDAYFDYKDNWGNDSSVAYRLKTPNKSVLFLGDLGARADVLANDPYFRERAFVSQIVQMSHHGQNGCSKEFYRQFKQIEIALYPGADWIFRNYSDPKKIGLGHLNTLETRAWMREFGVRKTFEGNKLHIFR